VSETTLPGVRVLISSMPTKAVHHVTEPGLGIVAQGAKNTVVGDRVFEYGEGDFVVTSVDLPIASHVVRASAARPYLACRMVLNPAAIASLLLEAPGVDELVVAHCGMGVHKAAPELLEAVLRLLRLLDNPRDAPVLRPLLEREILWRLLCGEQGGRVRQIGLADSRLAQVSHAIRWIRQHYAEAVSIEELAQLATMSMSSFHRHFRAVTAMTPIQFQKQIRLQEARAPAGRCRRRRRGRLRGGLRQPVAVQPRVQPAVRRAAGARRGAAAAGGAAGAQRRVSLSGRRSPARA